MKEDGATPETTARRSLLKLAGGGALALGAVTVTSKIALNPGQTQSDAGGHPRLVLASNDESDVSALEVRLDEDLLPKASSDRWQSRQMSTSTHTMVGFTWARQPNNPDISIRSRTQGRWQAWQRVPLLHDEPDAGSAERTVTTGTELVWIDAADGIQVHVRGVRPDSLTLVLLYPGQRPEDSLLPLPSLERSRITTLARGQVAQPRLLSRDDWGADESWRDGRPSYNHTLKQVHVHHTVNSNGYGRDDVPGLIRGMYRYHTQSLGWSDIAYNFLVDRFGRTWVGRAGGPSRLVRGAHTLGFNAESTGVSVIGNYDLVHPGRAVLDAVAALAAWKLHPFDRNPRGHVRVESEGSDKYRAGRVVRLPVIDGHRDTNDTACPGGRLYSELPRIRRKAARIIAQLESKGIRIDEPATISGSPKLGQTLAVDPGSYSPADAAASYLWLRDGSKIRGARERAYKIRPRDVGRQVSCRVTLKKRGLDPVSQVSREMGPVQAVPNLAVTTRKGDGRIALEVQVNAPEGVSAMPRGEVVVKVGTRSKVVTLSSGSARARFGWHRKIKGGRYAVSIAYRGDGTFLPQRKDAGFVRVR